MPLNLTVASWANWYANRVVPDQSPQHILRRTELLRARASYDFKVTGFNLASAVLITAVALAVITNCALFFALVGSVALFARHAFLREIDLTGLDQNIPSRIADVARKMLLIRNTKEEILKIMALEDQGNDWEPDAVTIGVPIWKNYLPAEASSAIAVGANSST